MKHWFNKNYKTLIIAAFLIPIITVAIVSISHVTQWYGISNPVTWSVYLSIGIEIAALSALAAISANMGSKVYFPFAIVTLIQFIGNIFFAYSYIDVNAKSFKDWVDLVSPLVEFIGVEPNDFVGHKRFLALFAGGMLPIISLSFLHMLVKFTEEDRKKEQLTEDKVIPEENVIDPSEIARIRLSENDLKKLEEVLTNPPGPNEALIKAAENYKKLTEEEVLKEAEKIRNRKMFEKMKEIQEAREEVFGPDSDDEDEPTALANSQYREQDDSNDWDDNDEDDWGGLTNEELIGDDELPSEEYKPTEEEETLNFETLDEVETPEEISLDEEPEIEINNTSFNEFAPEIIQDTVEEDVIEKPLFAPKEVEEVVTEQEISVVIDENDLKPFDVTVVTEPDPTPQPNFEVTTGLDDESLTEKKNF